MDKISSEKLALFLIRIDFVRELFSRLSKMIGVFGFGQDFVFLVLVFENIFSICLIKGEGFGFLLGFLRMGFSI